MNCKSLTKNQAIEKAEHYCAYQERSQQEVRDKLYDLGMNTSDVDDIISYLISTNFLNEERFALAYTRGKLRQKHWGRLKIKQGLKLKKVSEPLIRKAMRSIDADEYMDILSQILQKKASLLHEKDTFKRYYKLMRFALSRGFETDLISDALKQNNLA
ncbi:RecX family transcriptional regulator [Pedobacter sp. BS3]|uniref:regulatory protein RecX n=1 Tax=Pedobacter sp. BS3 TaxID=2567937 RepID=UPI0011EDFAFB|nr:regulatory protein RecX [Pedobacter sp. BS3]TZF83620.1 RecX family transcriptional regulator [Pedobacter sp. BS3]